MIICDRCEDRHRNSRVGIQLSGINHSEINWYNSPPTDYSKDLCIDCKRDLLVVLKEFFAENPKAPKPAPPIMYSQGQVDRMISDAIKEATGGDERKNDEMPLDPVVCPATDDDVPF